jgi:hypothetical protein
MYIYVIYLLFSIVCCFVFIHHCVDNLSTVVSNVKHKRKKIKLTITWNIKKVYKLQGLNASRAPVVVYVGVVGGKERRPTNES